MSVLPNPWPSQEFTDTPDWNSMVLEDFNVSGQDLQVTGVSGLFRAIAGFASFSQVLGYRVSFFDDAGLAANTVLGNVANLTVSDFSRIAVIEVPDGSNTYEYGLVSLDISVLLPAAGTYWVGIAPIAPSSGQFFLQSSELPASGGKNARFANPGQGFGAGALLDIGQDAAYSVTAIPEPSVLLCFAAAAGFLGCHRTRSGEPRPSRKNRRE